MLSFDIEITQLGGIFLDLSSFNQDRNGPSSDPVGAMCIYIYIIYIYIISYHIISYHIMYILYIYIYTC